MDRSPRLAELVVHLTGCEPHRAIAAVEGSMRQSLQSNDDALLIVARAMCAIRHLDLTERLDLRESNEVRTH